MQTAVISWRHPMDGSMYPPVGNPCAYLLENALCYIISGLMLLVVGVIITSLTFQNLEDYKEAHINRYAGPVLITAGILVIARGAFSHLCPHRSQFARRRSILRRYMRELYTRPILGLRNDTTDLCEIQVTNPQDLPDIQDCHRNRLYSDDPPPYHVVTSQHLLSGHLPELLQPGQNEVLGNGAFHNAGNDDCAEPPPTYEEFMRTTRL